MVGTREIVLGLSCLTCVAGASAANETTPLRAGTLVRVTAPGVSKGRLTGTLAAASEHEIVLALPGSEVKTIPRSAVTRLEWSPGHSRHPIAGAVIGGLLGGAFLASASLAMCDAASCSVSMPAFGIGFALGALPGAGVGALIRTRDWAEAAPSRVQVSLAPSRGRGVAVELELRF
jgi:hypothetical protein